MNSFSLTNTHDHSTVSMRFGDGPATVTEGYGGWQTVERPKRVAVTEWKGRQPIALEIPFVMDHWDTSGNAEDQVKKLEVLGGIGSHGKPATCILDGGGAIPHDVTVFRTGRWVVENISWDKAFEYREPKHGKRIRCGGTLNLREYVTATDILHKIRKKPRKPKTYKVKKGENLRKIAARKEIYHDSKKWKRIGDANHIRDGRKVLKTGRVLKIPRD